MPKPGKDDNSGEPKKKTWTPAAAIARDRKVLTFPSTKKPTKS
jgi:hypothetical protein